jgi:hypothetical protein
MNLIIGRTSGELGKFSLGVLPHSTGGFWNKKSYPSIILPVDNNSVYGNELKALLRKWIEDVEKDVKNLQEQLQVKKDTGYQYDHGFKYYTNDISVWKYCGDSKTLLLFNTREWTSSLYDGLESLIKGEGARKIDYKEAQQLLGLSDEEM